MDGQGKKKFQSRPMLLSIMNTIITDNEGIGLLLKADIHSTNNNNNNVFVDSTATIAAITSNNDNDNSTSNNNSNNNNANDSNEAYNSNSSIPTSRHRNNDLNSANILIDDESLIKRYINYEIANCTFTNNKQGDFKTEFIKTTHSHAQTPSNDHNVEDSENDNLLDSDNNSDCDCIIKNNNHNNKSIIVVWEFEVDDQHNQDISYTEHNKTNNKLWKKYSKDHCILIESAYQLHISNGRGFSKFQIKKVLNDNTSLKTTAEVTVSTNNTVGHHDTSININSTAEISLTANEVQFQSTGLQHQQQSGGHDITQIVVTSAACVLYEIDFIDMQQTNLQTYYIRRIRRLD